MQPNHAWSRQGSEAILLPGALEVAARLQNACVAERYSMYELYKFYFSGKADSLLEKEVREVGVAPLFFNKRSHMQCGCVGANNMER